MPLVCNSVGMIAFLMLMQMECWMIGSMKPNSLDYMALVAYCEGHVIAV